MFPVFYKASDKNLPMIQRSSFRGLFGHLTILDLTVPAKPSMPLTPALMFSMPFFTIQIQKNDLLSITGKTNVNHRKIVRIEPIVDNTDAFRGHGTHVTGTACGSAYCTNCGISQYNGIASAAKLYFSDIGSTTSGELSGTIDLNEQYKIFEELGVRVSR